MRIEGLIAATFSTFKKDGSVDLELIPALVEKLIDDGIKGIFICGTNGEGPNLTIEERMQIATAYAKAISKRIVLMVHVGHSSIAESKKLAAHAQQIDEDAISSVSAFYFKPNSAEAMVDCMSEIAAAAPQLPFYYYHIPALTGVDIDVVKFLSLAEQKIPSLAGLKYTATTLHEYQACYKDCFYLFSGGQLTDGKREYLRDAYSFSEKEGWKKINDLPFPVAAAPSPAFSIQKNELIIMGGDSGKDATQAATFKEKHPGFSNKILKYHLQKDEWSIAGHIFTEKKNDFIGHPNHSIWAPVTTTLVVWKDKIVIPGGEVRPGTRTPNVLVATPAPYNPPKADKERLKQ